MTIGDPIDETGTLLRDGGGFVLRLDGGGRLRLELRRMPVDEVEKHVRLVGVLIGPDHVDVEGLRLA
ncbi:DUF5818 domain-containing protein [Sphingomonas naphthae]|uniref:DUF5818 domain-containing protein n=1 Tax=Sphingomonas naphthae TaxID=1813468 RepID=A0ABY7TMY2_9SPHN|nr:DUF5818 domain-containing protein [Sphingomonas naphthae]WCT74587.1 DUF5818 domain-containing protein [Sphingomonas naphthae]